MTKKKKPEDDSFKKWMRAARERWRVRLMDGREAELLAVRKVSRSCKIKLGDRHYFVWVDDIGLVQDPNTRQWILLDAWKIQPIPAGQTVTPLAKARESRSWLNVKPDPTTLHPSFQPATPSPTMIKLAPSTERKSNA